MALSTLKLHGDVVRFELVREMLGKMKAFSDVFHAKVDGDDVSDAEFWVLGRRVRVMVKEMAILMRGVGVRDRAQDESEPLEPILGQDVDTGG